MFFSKLVSNKLDKYLIEDPGYCFGGNDRVTLINNKKTDEEIILEYLRLIKQINTKTKELEELTEKRNTLGKEIMGNPSLMEMFNELVQNDTIKKV